MVRIDTVTFLKQAVISSKGQKAKVVRKGRNGWYEEGGCRNKMAVRTERSYLEPELKGRNGVEIRLEAVRLKDGQGNI